MNPYYTHKEVCPGLFHIWEPAGVACTLIAGNTTSLLIDTGYGFGNLAAYVKTLTNAPLQLINTHGHLDHAGGNWQFTQAAWLHPFEDVYKRQTISSVLACLGNIGPGFNLVGPTMNFSAFSDFSKLVLSFLMIAGRLELFTFFMLFSPHYWNSNKC